ncbi:MAG: isochorismate synthase [Bacteroidota bacterium]|nr:isochorismate synthase [Bacteroidota bacterium]
MKKNLEIIDTLIDWPSWMNNHSFVVWRKPGEKKYKGFKASVEILHEGLLPEKEAFIFSPFNAAGKYPALVLYPKTVDSESTGFEKTFTSSVPNDLPDEKSTYCERVETLTRMMKEGSLHKCVLSRRIDNDGPDESLAPDLFIQLGNRYPDAFVSLVHIPGVYTWLGATPERLLKVEHQKAHTTALAATRRYEGVLPDISDWNVKEKEEQQLVTDYILKVLGDNHIDSIEYDGPRSMQAGNLVHLKTDIHFSIPPRFQILKLIKELHPTPAVCGLPKEEALKVIHSIEPYDREYYAGFMGPVSQDELELFVNLRCMRWVGGKPSLFVGGGITAASVPEQEWEETYFKAHTLLDVIEKLCNLAGKNQDAL